MYIVITKDGFMTSKEKENILKTDEVTCYCKSKQDCSDIIHGKRRRYVKKINKIPVTLDLMVRNN